MNAGITAIAEILSAEKWRIKRLYFKNESHMSKQPKARWIQRTHLVRKDEYECSDCGFKADKPYRLCPRCNTAMNGSKYDPSWVDEMEVFDAIFDD